MICRSCWALWLIARHHVLHPAQTLLQIVIDAGLVIHATAKAGARNAHQHEATMFFDDQRTARVTCEEGN